MKKLVVSFSLLLFTSILFSQEIKNPTLTKDDYLHKSRVQKKTANIFLIGGAACVVAALVFPEGEKTGSTFFYGDTHKNDDIRAVLLIAGTAGMLASIPFYLASSKNKRRAQAVTLRFKNENIIIPIQNALVSKIQPALNLRIML